MKRLLSVILLLSLLLCSFSLPAMAAGMVNETDAPAAPDISVSAYSAILIDMDNGFTLFEYDADEQNYPASTTKIMTAYLCLKYGDPEDTVTVSSSAFSNISDRASTGGLVVGETMTVHRLLQALLVVSASEAANVVGEYISGTHEEFVNLMNEEAEALGCTGTHFANCHGLPNSNHYTTARDMTLIARAAMQYEEFREIVSSAVTTMEATNKSGTRVIQSTNGILPGSSYPAYNYEYAIGIKTGHTSTAGYCLVSAADNGEHRLMCIIMGCGSRISSFSQTISLYKWGYENYDVLTYGVDLNELAESTEAPAEASASEPEEVTPSPTPEPTPTPTPTPEPSPEPTEAPEAAEAAFAEDSLTGTESPLSGLFEGAQVHILGVIALPLPFFVAAAILVLVLLIVLIAVIVHHSHKKRAVRRDDGDYVAYDEDDYDTYDTYDDDYDYDDYKDSDYGDDGPYNDEE